MIAISLPVVQDVWEVCRPINVANVLAEEVFHGSTRFSGNQSGNGRSRHRSGTGRTHGPRRPARLGQSPPTSSVALHPRDIKLCVKPVMANLIHTADWQGPCRWDSVPPEVEKANAEQSFARWSKQLKTEGLGRPEDVRVLEPVHVTFCENWVLKPEEYAKLAPDSGETDVYFMYPSGNSRSSYEIGNRFGKPIVLNGLGCRNTDIASYILEPRGTRPSSRATTWISPSCSRCCGPGRCFA